MGVGAEIPESVAGKPRRVSRWLAPGGLSARGFGPAEIWGKVRDWLVKHGVDVPEAVAINPAPEDEAPRF